MITANVEHLQLLTAEETDQVAAASGNSTCTATITCATTCNGETVVEAEGPQ